MSLVNAETGEVVDNPRQVMPPLTSSERRALFDSIQRFGVIVPIVVDQNGQIIDGHNRSEIAAELGMPCDAEVVHVTDEAHAMELAGSLNLDRRHMDEMTRARVAASLRQSGHSLRAIGRALGVDKRTISRDLDERDTEYQVGHDAPPNGDPEPEPDRVTGDDGKSYPRTPNKWTDDELLNMLDLYDKGMSQQILAEMHDVSQGRISSLLGLARELTDHSRYTVEAPPRSDDRSRVASAARRRIAAEMASTGHSSRQIAATLGITRQMVTEITKAEGIEVPADAIVGKTHHIDSNRVVSETVSSLEGITFGLNLVDFAELDPTEVAAWAESLRSSINHLKRFHKEMTK